jgi:hypothetical protein
MIAARLNQNLSVLNRPGESSREHLEMTQNSSLMRGRKARSAVFAPEDPRIQSQARWIAGSSPAMRD